VSSSAALKLFLAVALPLTLAWKASVRADDASYLEGDIAAFLADQKFEATASQSYVDHFPIILAERPGCRLAIMKASYYGADRDTVRSLTPPAWHLIFVYRGAVYAEQPVWLIVADQIWARFLHSLRLVEHAPPVLAVAAAAECQAESLPWQRLG
jgi:hypothetical protein